MKKSSLLFLLPALAMVVAGCDPKDNGGGGGGDFKNPVDVLTADSIFGEVEAKSYTFINDLKVEGGSGVSYYGKACRNGYEDWMGALQLNTTSGWLLTQRSNRYVRSITFEMATSPTGKEQKDKTINIFAHNASFIDAKDATGLEPVGTVSAETGGTYTFESDVRNFLIYASGAEYFDSITVEWDKEVLPDAVETIALNETTKEIGIGADKGFTLEATMDGVGELGGVTWSSDNTAVATVVDGKVTGVAAGRATITATSTLDSTKKATCAITVSNEKTEMSVYKLDTMEANGANSYAGPNDVSYNDVDWVAEANTEMKPWRVGGKSLDGVDRIIYTKTALSSTLEVDKAVIALGQISGLTLNKVSLEVFSTAENAANKELTVGDIDSVELTEGLVADAELTLNRTNGTSWVGAFYRFVFNVTVTATSNKYVQVKTIEFSGKN